MRFYLARDSDYDVVAFSATADQIAGPECYGLPLVPFETVQEHYPPDVFRMFIAVGYVRLNAVRARFFAEAKAKGYRLITYLSSKATHWGDTVLGENCFIFEDNTIQPFVTIGDNTILWSGNHIGHHSTIGAHCFISSHVVVSGHCRIGASTFVGVNATISDSVTVGDRNLIGACALLQKNTRPDETYLAARTKPFGRSSAKFFK